MKNKNCECGGDLQIDCTCKVRLSTDCITLKEDLVCSNILKGQTETEVLTQLDAYICERFESLENFFDLINVGSGSQVYKGISNIGKKQLRTLLNSNLITLTQGDNDITIAVNENNLVPFIKANQKTYSASNLGVGSEVYKNVTITGDNTQLNFRKLKSSNSSVNISQDTDEIDITVPAGVIPDGSETKINAGANITVTGNGTVATPYIINSIETNINAGSNITVSGNGSNATPYIISSTILQDNFVRTLVINETDLPINYSQQDICDYVLALPVEERTILETDSKWNIVIEEFAS